MSKKTSSTNLPASLADTLAGVGSRIRERRIRLGLPLNRVAEAAECSILTLMRVEQGVATVSFGTYARIMYVLGVDKDLEMLGRGEHDRPACGRGGKNKDRVAEQDVL